MANQKEVELPVVTLHPYKARILSHDCSSFVQDTVLPIIQGGLFSLMLLLVTNLIFQHDES